MSLRDWRSIKEIRQIVEVTGWMGFDRTGLGDMFLLSGYSSFLLVFELHRKFVLYDFLVTFYFTFLFFFYNLILELELSDV